MKWSAFALLALPLLCETAGARWEVQYFFDESNSTLTLTDIVFPSAQRGMASGFIVNKSHVKPVVLVTSNGGGKWTQVNVSEPGRSLFCLDETACWMVTPKGIWFTEETGRSWKKIKGEQNLARVFFLTRERGWALGAGKKLLETRDGGKSWTKSAAAESLKTSEERTVFHAVAFLTPKSGIITARSEPVEPNLDHPVWMDPEPDKHKEFPTLSVVFETSDAGEHWKQSTASMFGRISRLATSGNSNTALALIEFDRAFQFPSEVFRFDIGTGKQSRVLRRKDLAVTDIAMLKDGSAVAVGFEPPGAMARSPIPGRLRILQSANLETWTDMRVDYRAVAHSAQVAALDADRMWVATDTGMILHFVR